MQDLKQIWKNTNISLIGLCLHHLNHQNEKTYQNRIIYLMRDLTSDNKKNMNATDLDVNNKQPKNKGKKGYNI